jgi:hypothetical protein
MSVCNSFSIFSSSPVFCQIVHYFSSNKNAEQINLFAVCFNTKLYKINQLLLRTVCCQA